MPSKKTVQEQLDFLRREAGKNNRLLEKVLSQQKEQHKRIAVLEKKVGSPNKDTVIDDSPTTLNQYDNQEIPQSSSSSVPVSAILLIIFGALLTLTGIGALIGIPLVVWGIIIVSRNQEQEGRAESVEEKPIKDDNLKITPKPVEEKPKTSLEEDVGIKWFARIGIIALVIGIGFFIKYAIDMEWIGHLTRILLGALLGIGMIMVGKISSMKERYELWGKTLMGGGIAVLYFAVYASYHFEEYRQAIGIGQYTNIVLLSIIVLVAIWLSIRDNSQIIASESFFLGFLTALLSTEYTIMTMMYCILLALGIVIVTAYKGWIGIGIGGAIASYISYIVWAYPRQEFILGIIFLSILYTAFTIQSIILSKKKELSTYGMIIYIANSITFFFLGYLRVEGSYPEHTALLPLALFIIHWIIALYYKIKDNRLMRDASLYLSVSYIVMTVLLHFNNDYITLLWAMIAVITAYAYKSSKIHSLRYSAYALSLLVLLKILLYDIINLQAYTPTDIIGSMRLWSMLGGIGALYIIRSILASDKSIREGKEKSIIEVYSWTALSLLVIMILLEFSSQYTLFVTIALGALSLALLFNSRANNMMLYQATAVSSVMILKILSYDTLTLKTYSEHVLLAETTLLAYLTGITVLYIQSRMLLGKEGDDAIRKSLGIGYSYAATLLGVVMIMIEMQGYWISIGWSIYALILMAVGISTGDKQLRFQGIIVFGLTIIKVFLFDTRNLETIYRTISYTVLGALLLAVSFLYARYKEKLKEIL
ncbi:MAG: DUF2339 domain-containing protein [Candidatus Woesearchaeota archaeon]